MRPDGLLKAVREEARGMDAKGGNPRYGQRPSA